MDIYINYGTNLLEMTYELLEEIRFKELTDKEMRICICPDMENSSRPYKGSVTHPEIVEAIVKFLKRNKYEEIVISSSPWIGRNTEIAANRIGYHAISQKYNIPFIDAKTDNTVLLSYEKSSNIYSVSKAIAECDYLINVATLKPHIKCGVSGAISNLESALPDEGKREIYTIGIHSAIAELATLVAPDLNILDNVCSDIRSEDGGNPLAQDRILMSFDPVLLDSYAAELIGYYPKDIPYLLNAAEYGAGQLYSSKKHNIVNMNNENIPKTTRHASKLSQQLGSYIVSNNACSSCYAAAIYALERMISLGHPIDELKIYVGRGYKNKSRGAFGVGNCCSGFSETVSGCPVLATDILAALASKVKSI